MSESESELENEQESILENEHEIIKEWISNKNTCYKFRFITISNHCIKIYSD